MAESKWPGISVSAADRELIQRIRENNGVLKNIPMKDLLLLAASLGFRHKLPALNDRESLTANIVHPTLMMKTEYADYKQYIAMIFYFTGANEDLANMSDKSSMVKNFVDYAQRGLRFLESTYLNEPKGSDKLVNDLMSRLNELDLPA